MGRGQYITSGKNTSLNGIMECFVAQGSLAVVLALVMTVMRHQILTGSREKNAFFDKFSRAQANNAEWTPTIMVLQLAMHWYYTHVYHLWL